jgi:hypothetical protein
MKYKDVLGEEIMNYSVIHFTKLSQYHEYIQDKEDDLGSGNWVRNDKIYLDGDFNAEQLEALALFLKDKTK